MNIYDIFFSICLGLFIGGVIMSLISIILAEISVHDSAASQIDHLDHIDHIDHIDHFDHVDHIDQVDHIDHFDHVDHIDHIDHPDHMDHTDKYDHIDSSKDLNHFDDTTPAPFMLLFSTSLLVFGISGILFYYIIGEDIFRFLLFIITPLITYTITKLISVGWKKMAKSRYYVISSTANQIGKEGEVVLKVDRRGGVIKIPSQTPLKFEKIHVKPYRESDSFEQGTKVYICDIQGDYLLVDTDKNSIRGRK